MKKSILFFVLFAISVSSQSLSAQELKNGQSVYPVMPADKNAVYLTKENFSVAADGVGDDAPALQSAIDQVLKNSRNGIVFIPQGTYRLGKTVRLWSGIRLIGYGAKRPVFKLGDHTPGFQEGDYKYMVHFCQSPGGSQNPQPGTWQTPEFVDATWVTFYSGIHNINFEIGNGNPAAIAVRYHVAQVCALENIDFNIGNGRGAVEEMGNLVDKCTFRGGEWGIKTNSSSPDWQCMVLDCSFEGQREASMITNNAKMLVIRSRFKNAPVGILVPDREKLFVKDTWFENISKSALVINNFVPPDLQVNLENVRLSNVPYSVRFNGRTQGWSKEEVKMDYAAPSPVYEVKNFSHGLHIDVPHGSAGPVEFTTKMEQAKIETLGDFTPVDLPVLPAQSTWINIADLGAKGDGETDCTDIFEKAIAGHETI
ncbi:MAG TPA: glycosyl hydrolase family 28-related protein, partial [Prolixibacteraceae bacterium]|nr:glycosyl hydrolase family 28-related protein [Prolixibacteraceae bacterium]